ncbi:hypothetical protein CEUSTIGMA_g13872.t1 [Chlamydomonas eustigma]|uniref:Uncharacterized protein n=1 Tax=Chlamydomonas eustigma TaxID=1157962 RepID=A0A250XU52_9CHLO|nr:hypothetical protein CEUSTIGMA_g13872.t1 [Chlamydomonas eustigma]|eukprot:GAX86462.1 hypothetical protein CEUSTIGMA_g13872.t1 [Chlamydomonas eustigma]
MARSVYHQECVNMYLRRIAFHKRTTRKEGTVWGFYCIKGRGKVANKEEECRGKITQSLTMRGMMHSQAKKAKNIATAVSGHSNTPSPCISSAAHGHAPVLPCGSHNSAQSAYSSTASKQLTKASKISHSKTPMSTLNTTSAGSSLAHKSEHNTYTTPTTGGSNTSTASVSSKPQIKVLVAAVTMKPSEAVPMVTNPEEVTSHSPRKAEPALTPQEEDSSHSPEDMSDHPETAELSTTSAPSFIDHAFDDNDDDDDEHHIPLSCMEDAGQDKERIGQVYAAAGHSDDVDDAEIGDMGQICAVQGRNVPDEDLNSNVQGDGHLYEVSRVLFPPSPHTLGGLHDVQQRVNNAHPGQLKLYDREETTALDCSEGGKDAELCRRHSDSNLRHIGRRYGSGSGMSRQNGSGDSDGRIDDGSAVVQWFKDQRNRGTTPPSSNACSDISENGGGCRKSQGRSEQIYTSCRKSSVDLSVSSAGESIESAGCNEVSSPLGEEHGRRYGEEGEDDRVAPGHILHQREAQSIIHTCVDPSVDKEIIPGSWRTLPGRLVPSGNSAVVQPTLPSKIFPVSPTSAAAAAGLTIAGSSRNESTIQYEAALALLKQSSFIASTKHVSSNRDVQARSSNISSNPHSSMCSSYGSSSTKEPPPSLTLAFKHPQDTVEHINTYAAMPVRFGSNYIAEKGDLTSFLDVMPFHSLLGRPVGNTAIAADVVAAMIPKQQQQQGESWTEGAALNHYCCSITPPPPPPPPPPPRIDWAVSQPADTGSICASDATSAAAASTAVIGCSATRSFASVVAEKPPATAVSSIPAPGLLAASALRFLTASADTVSSRKAASGLSLVGTQVTSKRGAMKAAGGRSACRVETFSTAAGANASCLAGGCIANTKARRGRSAGAPDVTRQQPRQPQGDTSLTSLGRYTSNKEQEGSRSPGSLSASGWKSAKGRVKGNIPPHYLPQLHTLYSESLCDTSIITGCHSNSNTCSHVLPESSAGSASGSGPAVKIRHTLKPDPNSCDSSDTSRVGAGDMMLPAMSLQRHQQKQQQQQQYDSAAASSTAAHCPQFLWLQEKAQQKLLEPGPADVLLPQRQFHSSQLAAGFDPGFKSSSCLGAMHPSTSVDDPDRECSSLLLSSQHQGMIHNNRVGGGDASCMVSAVRRAVWWEADSSHDALAAASPAKQPYMR